MKHPSKGASLRHKENGGRYFYLGRRTNKGVVEYLVRRQNGGFDVHVTAYMLEVEADMSAERTAELDQKAKALAEEEARALAERQRKDREEWERQQGIRLAVQRSWETAEPYVREETRRPDNEFDNAHVEVWVEGKQHVPARRERPEAIVDDYNRVEVYCTKRTSWVNKDLVRFEPQVNWSALGSQSPALARAYARAILLAADEAERLANLAYAELEVAKDTAEEPAAE